MNNFTTHEILRGSTSIAPIGCEFECECDQTEFYIIGATVVTTVIAFVSECMSLSKCGGDSNGVIQAIKKCISITKNISENMKEDTEIENEDKF